MTSMGGIFSVLHKIEYLIWMQQSGFISTGKRFSLSLIHTHTPTLNTQMQTSVRQLLSDRYEMSAGSAHRMQANAVAVPNGRRGKSILKGGYGRRLVKVRGWEGAGWWGRWGGRGGEGGLSNETEPASVRHTQPLSQSERDRRRVGEHSPGSAHTEIELPRN